MFYSLFFCLLLLFNIHTYIHTYIHTMCQYFLSFSLWIYSKKSCIRETKNLSTDADSRTDTVLETTGFATHVFIKKLQQMEELFEKADWLFYTCFHQEIADGRARRGGRLLRANLRANERPRKKLHSMAQTHRQTDRQTDMATLLPTRPSGAELVKICKIQARFS